jgi:hypothetical protein
LLLYRTNMWLEAILSRADLEQAIRSFTPATISMGDHGSVCVEPPTHVELVPRKGLRAVCPATVHGSLFGVDVPVTVSAARFLLWPSVVSRSGGDVLVFTVTLESIDVGALPHLLETVAVDAINAALVAHGAELAWNFRETLSHRFALPAVITAIRSLDISAAWGEIRITEEALVFAVSIHIGSNAKGAEPAVLPPRPPPPRKSRRPGRVGLLVAGGVTVLAASLLALIVAGRRHPRLAR